MEQTARMPDEDLMTTAEACRFLGDLDRSTLIRWVQLGKITPAERLSVGGRYGAFRFHRADVEALAADLEAKAAAS